MKNFVDVAIATKLKEIGFNEPCLGYFRKDDFIFFSDIRNCNTNSTFQLVPTVPTIAQVVDWFLTEKEIFISPMFDDNTWTCDVFDFCEPDLSFRFTVALMEKHSFIESLHAKNEVLLLAIRKLLDL